MGSQQRGLCFLWTGRKGESWVSAPTRSIIGGNSHKYTFWHDKSFVATKCIFCHDKSVFVMTKLLLWQRRVCHDKFFVVTKMIHAAAPASRTEGSMLHNVTCFPKDKEHDQRTCQQIPCIVTITQRTWPAHLPEGFTFHNFMCFPRMKNMTSTPSRRFYVTLLSCAFPRTKNVTSKSASRFCVTLLSCAFPMTKNVTSTPSGRFPVTLLSCALPKTENVTSTPSGRFPVTLLSCALPKTENVTSTPPRRFSVTLCHVLHPTQRTWPVHLPEESIWLS